MRYDVVIVGGGPAGLSAALMLGRCRRSVLVIDAGEPRNRVSRGLHGFLTQDGVRPEELRNRGRADAARYPSILLRDGRVTGATSDVGGFVITVATGEIVKARILLLATGRADPLPEISGAREFFGRGVHHCPYCDGWEYRGGALAVVGGNCGAGKLAAELFTWSNTIFLLTDGAPQNRGNADSAKVRGLGVIEDKIARLEGAEVLERIHFAGGREALRCDALFFATDCVQKSALPEALGCRFDAEGSVVCDDAHRALGVPGLYVAGNVRGGPHLAITAAAEGAEAAVAINEALLKKDEG